MQHSRSLSSVTQAVILVLATDKYSVISMLILSDNESKTENRQQC